MNSIKDVPKLLRTINNNCIDCVEERYKTEVKK
jgi:hypothetical protein